MEESKEFTGKTVEEALESALSELNVTVDQIEYEVLEKESNGFLGLFNNKPAKISVKLKTEVKESNKDLCEIAKVFLNEVLSAMDVNAQINVTMNEEGNEIGVDLTGDEMGILIGKRGATLDSLQYLVSLVVNKESDSYVKVKLDTENYRERRKETLENLAHNIAGKVKKTRRSVTLEPMNPYERRIIHSCLQQDSYVETHSEGEEPFRKVVITLKKGVYIPDNNRKNFRGGRKSFGSNNNKRKINSSREFHKKYGADTKDYSTDYKKDYADYLESKAAAKAAAEKLGESI
ncbi:MAG: protein jag [Lachnospiraceae bacterium]|nr:protein jag [Lachnospiraceae bacterium]